ncbi:Uncharacterised protein [Plesiomonas shigelloides]|nr:Uncharacterised protein [Plesiomonas shigelloides]
MTQTVHYIPKGSMCAVCKQKNRDCSHLDFERMKVITDYGWDKIVKCTEFERCQKM